VIFLLRLQRAKLGRAIKDRPSPTTAKIPDDKPPSSSEFFETDWSSWCQAFVAADPAMAFTMIKSRIPAHPAR
jgi:hypothetical protein